MDRSTRAGGILSRSNSSSRSPTIPSRAANSRRSGVWSAVEKASRTAGRRIARPYPRYSVYAGQTTREGIVHIALGEAERAKAWGRDRPYIIAFLTSGAPQTPLVEFLATDDYEESGEYLAIVRGRDGGRRLYGPGDTLPDVYEQHFRTQMYGDRVDYPGVWNKVVVIAHEDDHPTMLNHALVQARRRGDL